MSLDDRRPMKNIAARLSMPDELLTLEEARTLAQISTADRSLEMLGVLQDIQSKLMRMEIFLSVIFPDYNEYARHEIQKALAAHVNGDIHVSS